MRNQHERFNIFNAIMAYCISAPGATKLLMDSVPLTHVRLSYVRWMNPYPPKQGYPV